MKIEQAKKLLEEGGTKKAACELLGINYNTAKLAKLIEDYERKKEIKEKRRRENKGTAIRPDEYEEIILQYFTGSSVAKIADYLCRPASYIKETIEHLGIPCAPPKNKKGEPYLLPYQCFSDNFDEGDLVWACRYHAPARVKKPCDGGYWVYVLDKEPGDFQIPHISGFNAACAFYDLGSLKHLETYINLDKLEVAFYDR